MKNLKIAFFGTPRLAQIVLERLIDSPYKPNFVITAPDAKVGRGQSLQPSPVKQTALKHNVEIHQPNSLAEKNFQIPFRLETHSRRAISNFKLDLAILVAYGKIIPSEMLSIPTYGIINIHPSLLPKYRGPSPIQSAILAGEEKTGATIIKLDELIDHGPILAKEELAIEETDTHASLIEKLGKLGAELLVKTLPDYLEGKITPIPQEDSKATLTKKITRQDGYVTLSNPPDHQTLDRMIRAFFPWPTVWSKLRIDNGELRIKLLPTTILPGNSSDTFVIQPEGKKPMTIKDFLNGYPKAKDLVEKLVKK